MPEPLGAQPRDVAPVCNDAYYPFSKVARGVKDALPVVVGHGRVDELPEKLFASRARAIIDWNIKKISGDHPEVSDEDISATAARGVPEIPPRGQPSVDGSGQGPKLDGGWSAPWRRPFELLSLSQSQSWS